MVKGLSDEIIDVIVSDHKPEDEEQKRLTFAQAETGATGIETLLSLSLELYHNGSVKLETIIKALTSNPAKILKIDKGNLSIGNDADFQVGAGHVRKTDGSDETLILLGVVVLESDLKFD